MKKGNLILLLIGLSICSMPMLIWSEYIDSQQEIKEEWYREEFLNKNITGQVKDIIIYDETSFKLVFTIWDESEEFERNYGIICASENFVKYVSKGMEVF